jgi:large subunit ribosomal protein L9
MANNVQVVLKEDVDNLGRSGDLVKVKPGYARNYLIPRGLAAAATRQNLAEIEHHRRIARMKMEKERAESEKAAKVLEGVTIQIAKEAGDEGKLFGSVTAAEIVEALERKGIEIDKKKLLMPDDAIKTTGEHTLEVKFPAGVRASFKLRVVTKA